MREGSFSEELSNARKNRRLSETQVSQALRIMPSIIRALEQGDFAHMPHIGFTRNMVSSYARYLGLDCAKLTEQFLREYREYERWRSNNTRSLTKSNSSAHIPQSNYGEITPKYTRPQPRPSRSIWDRGSDQLDAGYDSTSRQTEKQTRKNIQRQRKVSSLFSRISSMIFGRPVVVIVLLLVVLILLIVGVGVLFNNCSANNGTPEVISVTGAVNAGEQTGASASGTTTNKPANTASTETNTNTATDATSTDTTATADPVDSAEYGDFELSVSTEGGSSWLVINVDGKKVFDDKADSGYSNKFTVTSKATIEAGAPSYVTVKRNGKTQKLKITNGVGSLTLKVKKAPASSKTSTDDSSSKSSSSSDSLLDNPSETDIPSTADLTGR